MPGAADAGRCALLAVITRAEASVAPSTAAFGVLVVEPGAGGAYSVSFVSVLTTFAPSYQF
jgi:hypothetical protein